MKELTELEKELIADAWLSGSVYGANGEKELPSIALEKASDRCKRLKHSLNIEKTNKEE